MNKQNCCNAIAKNPLLILFLGACPAMAATASVKGALGMGIGALVVMVLTNLVIAALRKNIPAQAMIPVCVVVSTGFVSIVQMLMNAFLPNVYQMLGVYLAVVAVNLVVFGQAEAAANGNSVVGAVKTGLYFTVILVVMGIVREVLGNASIFGVELAFLANYRIPLLAKAPGGFLVASIVAGVVSKLAPAKDECAADCVTCAAAGIGECCCTCEEKEVQE